MKLKFALSILVLSAGVGCRERVGSREGADVDLLASAWQHVRYYEFDQAEPLFRRIRAQSEVGGERWKEATFGLATALHHKRPFSAAAIEEAQGLFTALAEHYPDDPFAARALMNLARICELRDYYKDTIDLAKARELYQKVIDGCGGKPIASEAVLRLAQSYISTFEPEAIQRGLSILQSWLEKHPRDPLAGLMWLYMGDVYFYPLEDYRRCVEAYLKADELNSLEPGQEGLFYWRIAYLSHTKLDRRDLAIPYYTKLITEVPSYGRGYQAQLALKELGMKEIPDLRWAPKPKAPSPGPLTGEARTP